MTYTIIALNGRCKNLTGQTFGRLTAINPVGRTKHGNIKWLCICTCGSEVTVPAGDLKGNKTGSCGCLKPGAPDTKHGLSNSPGYSSWINMRSRCNDNKNTSFKYYGHRGITVCSRWNDFSLFIKDMGDMPSSKHTIDRIDNDMGYSPENCRWATQKEQCRNMRSNVFIEFNNKTRCISEWAEITGIKRSTLDGRIKSGWSVKRALTETVNSYSK